MEGKTVNNKGWNELLNALVSFFDAQPDTYKVIYRYVNKGAYQKQYRGTSNGITRLLSYDVIKNAWENGGDYALAKLAAYVHYYGSKIETGQKTVIKMVVTSSDIIELANYIKKTWGDPREDNGMNNDFTLNWEDLQEITKRVIGKLLEEGYYGIPKQDRPGIDRLYKMKWDYRYPFGRYKGRRVDEVYKSNITGKEYVGWVYYNMEMVDYDQSILEELGLQPIEKPGVNKELFVIWKQENFTEDQNIGMNKIEMGKISHAKKIAREKAAKHYANFVRDDERAFTKGKMAWKNQGH